MGGAKSRHFLSASNETQLSRQWELWKQLYDGTTSKTHLGMQVKLYKDIWIHFNKMALIMRRSKLQSDDANNFQKASIEFSKRFVKVWGESNFTHYMASYSISLFLHIIILNPIMYKAMF